MKPKTKDVPGDVFAAMLRRTSPGMAHLAGSGPPRRTCKDFRHFEPRPTGGILTGCCKAYRILRPKPKKRVYFDRNNQACRHFDKA